MQENQNYGSFILECKSPYEIGHCAAEHLRSQRVFNIRDGLQHERYSSFKTNFAKRMCQFEIPKTNYEDDVGKWELKVTDTSGVRTSCHFVLHSPVARRGRGSFSEPVKQALNKLVNSTINCAEDVTYTINWCYIRDPDNIPTRSKDCKFTLNKTGEWLCGFNAGSSGLADIQQTIQVHSSGAIDGKFEANSLQCRHFNNKPLRTCIIISPENRPFSADVNAMSAGICRATLKANVKMMNGEWKCVIQDKENDKLYETKIVVTNPNAESREDSSSNETTSDNGIFNFF